MIRNRSDTHISFAVPAPPRPTPALPGHVVVADTVEELVEHMADDLVAHCINCCRRFGDFHLALSGGATPVPFYRHLMTDPVCRRAPWRKTHLWQVDEHRVPVDDERSNWKLIRELLGDHAGIPAAQLHPMPALDDSVEDDYEKALQRSLEWRERGQDRLDYILLGVGARGATAGLLPNSPAVRDPQRFVRLNDGPAVALPGRVTMTLRLINAARFVAVMVTGKAKRAVIQQLAMSDAATAGAGNFPILGVNPVGGVLRWYLDADACPDC